MDGAARLAVLHHALGPVAEGDDAETFAANRHALRHAVHFIVRATFGHDVAAHPGVQDARAVDAEQHAQAGLFRRVVHVGEGVDTRERVVVHRAVHAVDHARRAGGGSDFSGIEHVQRQRVVRLVPRTVGDGDARLDSQFLCHGGCHAALLAEGGTDFGNQVRAESEVVHQFLADGVAPEVPENAFAEAGHRGAGRSREAEGDIVAREHDFVNPGVHVRFVLLHPGQFAGREVARRVEQVAQAEVLAERVHGAVAVRDGARVAPDDGGAEGLSFAVRADQPVHLVTDADGGQPVPQGCHAASRLCGGRGQGFRRGVFQVAPPCFGVLFRPSGLQAQDGGFLFGVEGVAQGLPALRVHHASLDRRAAYVISDEVHTS